MSNDLIITPYATLGKRFLAVLLDGLILAIPCAILNSLVPILGGMILWLLYAPILESSELRATLGKYIMGIQVTSLTGQRISFRVSMIRNLIKCVSSLLLFLGFLFALFTDKKQTLHDLLAETLVVNGKSTASVTDAWTQNFQSILRSKGSSLAEIERLQALRERGALSEEEFQEQKRKILEKE